MTKPRLLALLLCLLLTFQCLTLSTLATSLPEEPEAQAEESTDPEATDEAPATTSEAPSQPANNPLELNCSAAYLIELNSDTAVYDYNADQRLFPASLTKIMSCLLALERGTLSEEVTVNGALFADMDPDASTANLVDGETLTLEQLLYCMMIPSANDASIVVADYIGGSVDAFVQMMNDRATELGCTGTHFVNPDGLHDENHYTTARDLAIIASAALEYDVFRTMCSTAIYELPATNLSEARVYYTTNFFLDTTITAKYYWDAVSGVKTGFTTPAGRCLVSLAESSGRSFLSVVLGCPTTYDEDGEPVYEHFVQSRKLLEYGLDHFSFVSVLSHLSPIAQVPVRSGKANSVVITPQEDVNALLPIEYDENKLEITYTLDDGESLEAPVEADEVVGTATVTYDGQVVGSTPVQAITDVARAEFLQSTTEPDAPQEEGSPSKLLWILLGIVVLVLLLIILLMRSAGRKRAARRRRRRR